MNGLNVIRCSENQVQVYELKDIMGKVISTIVECDRRNEIYYNKYIGLEWNALKLICSSDNDKVREEQTITRVIPGDIDFISDVKGQLDQSTDSYELEFEDTLSDNVKTMVSSEQLADSTYFKADRSPKQRTIYVWFPNHPIICRLRFISDEDNPCPSLHEKSVDANYACYYYPGATALPTKEQMEAELKQIEETDKPDDTEAYVLDLTIPEPASTDTSDTSDSSDDDMFDDSFTAFTPISHTSNRKPNHRTKALPSGKKPFASNSADSNKKNQSLKIIGFIIGLILLVAFIGCIIYFINRKYHCFKSSSLSKNTDNDNKSSYSIDQTQSQQSLAATSAYGASTEVSANASPKQQPAIKLQSKNGNIRQRADTSIIFDENI